MFVSPKILTNAVKYLIPKKRLFQCLKSARRFQRPFGQPSHLHQAKAPVENAGDEKQALEKVTAWLKKGMTMRKISDMNYIKVII